MTDPISNERLDVIIDALQVTVDTSNQLDVWKIDALCALKELRTFRRQSPAGVEPVAWQHRGPRGGWITTDEETDYSERALYASPPKVVIVTDEMVERGLAEYSEGGCSGLADYERREVVVSILTAALSNEAPPTHRHKKRGSEYVLIGIGKMQSQWWFEPSYPIGEPVSVDMREVAIYRSVDDGSLWVRPREEFEDGRFEVLSSEAHNGQ